jgi:hypothetical protein
VIDNEGRNYQIEVYPDAQDAEVKRTLMHNSLADYRPTGLHAKPNETLSVQVVSAPAGTTLQALIGHWQQKTGVASPAEIDPVFFTLTAGATVSISSTYGGPVYLRAVSSTATGKAVFKIPQGGTPMPFVQLYRNSDSQWRTALNDPNVTPFVEVLTNRTLLTFETDKVKAALAKFPASDVTAIALKFDEMAASHDDVAGLNLPNHQIHKPRPHLLHATPHNRANYYMFATNWRMGFCADTCAQYLFTNQFVFDGWGPWHEAGHKYQGSWEWSELGEVSVNLYSLEFERRLGARNRLVVEDSSVAGVKRWERALTQRATIAKFDELDVFERLVPFWQLRLAYGLEFWQRLHRNYRDPATRPAALVGVNNRTAANAELARQTFVVEASRAAGQDLSDYFTTWKFAPSADTLAKVAALNLPKADTAAILALRPQ